MVIIVDTNILFSACISPNNKISELLFSPLPSIERISCYYAMAELFKYQPKIIKLAKQPADKISMVVYAILKQVEFINENIIEPQHWIEADRLTSGVDSKDINFVALTLQKSAWLWTGDKKLTTHLKAMGFDQVVTTSELYEMIL
ncbi:hypothetical protein GCM10028808_46580 [Spirosoma migulaei]